MRNHLMEKKLFFMRLYYKWFHPFICVNMQTFHTRSGFEIKKPSLLQMFRKQRIPLHLTASVKF